VQLPRSVHFRKQLLAQGGRKFGLSYLDHLNALPTPELLALEASSLIQNYEHSAYCIYALTIAPQDVCSRLSLTLLQYPRPCRVLGLDVNRAFMAGLATVVFSLAGSLVRLVAQGSS
jgi:hypothetical protein